MLPYAHVTMLGSRLDEEANVGGRVLEVRQRWGDLVLDARHFGPSAGEVRIGTRLGWRWQLLGVDMGPVPASLAQVLPWFPPIWSEVHQIAVDDFVADEALGTESERLLHHDAGSWWIEADEGWLDDADALVETGRAERRRGRLRVRVDGEPLSIVIGALTFEVREVLAARRVERASTLPDPGVLGTLGVLASCGVLLAVVTAFAPRPPAVEVHDIPDRFLELAVQVPDPPKPKPKAAPAVEEAPAAPRTEALGPRRKTRERGGERQREADMAVVQQAGILGGGVLDGLLGDGRIDDALAAGVGRLAARGGGGPSVGLGGRGGLGGGGGVESVGFGVAGPTGTGTGGDGLGVKRDGQIELARDVITIGTLERSEVDEVVRQHLTALRYCYQRELQKDASLQGKVTMRFVIASDGSVSSAEVKHSTVRNEAVERCLSERFLRMRFPEPRGGGMVIVSYPLVFARG